jgi:PAS domain S-box-containing protein
LAAPDENPEPIRILIVEDESLIALELRKKLEESGFTVCEVADNGADALLYVERLQPDLVLMDIRLRGNGGNGGDAGDGIATAEQIRRQFHVPVMFVTGHADRATLDRARNAEPFGYVGKPFHGVDFRAPIEMALRKHKMEQELLRSETRCSKRANEKAAVLDAAPNAVIMVGADGLMNLVNTQTEKLFGYAREELLGQPIEMLIPERLRLHHGDQRKGFFAAPATRPMGNGRELFGRRRDGSEVPVEIGLNPILTTEGPCVVAAIIDITERIKAQEMLRLLVEAAPNAMVLVGPDGLMSLVNSQTGRLFGYEREELLGQPVSMLIPRRFRKDHLVYEGEFIAAAIARPMGKAQNLFGLRKDGSEVPCEIGLNPIVTADGQCIVASIVDITAHIRERETLRRSLAEMTTLLKEVHHRVKNNLQVICSLLSMQIECLGDRSTAGPLTDAHTRVLAMSLIHEQIYQSQTLADMDFGEYVKILSERLFSAYCVDRSRIRLELSVEPVCLNVDSAIPCGLILNELLANSLKHAFGDGREGVIRVSLQKTAGGFVEIVVADNGVGLPAGFRAEECSSLGLQVVRSLIHQLRAEMSIAGAGGATFSFRWKLPEPAA